MGEKALYVIVRTRYQPNRRDEISYLETLAEAKEKALAEARKNIGVRYAVFQQGSQVAEFQAYYRTTVKCPKCGEVIPIE
jgi:hypothetical protein